MKLKYVHLPIQNKYVLYVDDTPWAVRDTLVELVVIADAIYKFGPADCWKVL